MIKLKLKITRYFLLILTCLLVQITSSTEFENDNLQDDNLMVIIGKIPRQIEDVIGSASVITREQLDYHLVQSFDDLARYLPEIDVEQSGTRFGQSSLSIRGIGGNRVALEIDGIPIADQFSIGSYSNSGRNLLMPELLQQIEILRGPASSIYGSDAIGGVVNFVRRKPRDFLLHVKDDSYLGLSLGYHSEDDTIQVSGHGAWQSGQLSGSLSLSKQQGHELDHAAKLQAESSISPRQGEDLRDNQTESFLLQLVYDLNLNSEIVFAYDRFMNDTQTELQSILGLGRFSSTTGLMGDDQSTRSTTSLSFNFDNVTNNNLSWIDGGSLKLFHQQTETNQLTDESRLSRGVPLDYERRFFFEQVSDGIRANLYSNYVGKILDHTIGFGVEYSKTEITEYRDALQTNLETSETTNIILSEDFPVRDFPISNIEEIGLYINDQLDFSSSNFKLIPALRFDHYKLNPKADSIFLQDNPATSVVNVSTSNWSPRIAAEYSVSDNQSFYLQYIRGFRSPPFEDANIGLDIPLFNIRAIPNPDLKPETSDGYEFGFRAASNKHQLNLTLFWNQYDNFIQSKVNLGLDPDSGRVIFQSQNLESAEIYGGDLNYRYLTENLITPGDQFTFTSILYKSKGKNKVSQTSLNQVGPGQLIFDLDWASANGQWKASLVSTIVESKTDIEHPQDQRLFEAPSYSLLDAFVHYQPTNKHLLSLALLNITDQTYWRWSAVQGVSADDPLTDLLSSPGRSISVQYKLFW